MEEVTSVVCTSLDNMQMKTCTMCLETVKVHVTCFKCNKIYHPQCLIKAPTSYMNKMGRVSCCQILTSQYNTFETKTESQENKNESFKEEDVCVSDEGLENNGLAQEEYKKAENTCDMHFKKENTLESQENNNESFKEEEVWVSDGLDYSGPEQEECKKAENTCDMRFKKENTLESQEDNNESFKAEEVWVSDGLEYSVPEQEEYKEAENTCDISFKKENTLDEVNEDKDDFVCSFCEVKFFEEKPYSQHIKLCKRNNFRLKKRHGAAIKLKKMFKCDKCDYQAKWSYLLKEHLNIHSLDKRFKCTFKSCKCVQSLDTTQVKPCGCRPCEYTTGIKENLERHISRTHGAKDKIFKCNDCSYTARQKSSLREHIFTHLGLKPFRCGTCEFATVSKRGLDQHVTSQHSDPQKIDVACSFCEMKFVEEKSYKRHLKLCGRNNLRPTQDSVISTKLHKCEKCTYTSKWLSQVKKHLATHSTEKPFKCTFKNCACTPSSDTSQVTDCDCSVCEYRTGNKRSFDMHVLRHNQKGRYECNDCAYTCHNKTVLREHILFRHLRKKLFVCDTCGFESYRQKGLNYHMKTQPCGNYSQCNKVQDGNKVQEQE